MAIAMGDLKKGLKIEISGVPYQIVEYQHVKSRARVQHLCA